MMTQIANFSPGRAALLGVIPGMGAAYNRQYDKAAAHFGVFAGLCIFGEEGHGIFALAAVVFYIFTILDAYRSAQNILASGQVPGAAADRMSLPLWGGLLVVLGLLFFLDNIDAIPLSRVLEYSWPLLFVGIGVYLIFRYYVSEEGPEGSGGAGAPPPTPPPPATPPGSPPPDVSREVGPGPGSPEGE